MARTKLRSELGKGVEALRKESVTLTDNLAGSVTYIGIIGPFETDIDVKSITVTLGGKPASGTDTLDVFKGTIAANVPMITQVDNTAIQALTAQVPSSQTILAAGNRVTANTPITVRYVGTGSNAAAPASVTVRVGYDIPTYDPVARVTTYGAYDDGE